MGSAYFDAHSLWQRSEKPLYTSVNGNLRVDTCIVGAGIAGLSVAYQLLKAGQSVAVVERERLGLGETALSSAHLASALDEGFVRLQKLHGREGARLAAESHAQAIDWIEEIQRSENIACDFKRVEGYLFLGKGERASRLIEEREAALQSGLADVHLLDRAPVKLFESGPALNFPRQAQIHPLRYLDGLAEAVLRLDGQIFTHSEVVEINGGREAYVKTSQGFKVEADHIVVATNVPFNSGATFHAKNPAYRSYIIGLPVPAEKVDAALMWDTSDPYHYLRFVKDPTNEEDILLVGGEDHRTGQGRNAEEHFARLHTWVRERLDLDSRVVTRWSGQILEPVDGLAYIGRNPGDQQNVFIVSGDSGHGLTHGTIAGMLLRDLILGIKNPWERIYDPSRLHFRSLTTFVKDALQSSLPYADWLSTGDVETAAQIENGEGAVLREGLAKVAVFKDEAGRVHMCSAVCPHLGGIVRWNSAEKTWDCPCHGSRFDRFGQVINGPALIELAPVGDPFEGNAAPIETLPL